MRLPDRRWLFPLVAVAVLAAPPASTAAPPAARPRPAPQSQPAEPDPDDEAFETVVTGSRSAQARFDSDRSIGLVTAERLAAAQARSVPEAAEEAPGVHLQQTNRGSGAPIIRGLVGPQNLILLDGIPFNTSTFRVGPNQYLALIDPFATDRIEVVRGPSSVLYGSGAMGGVLHVLTVDPRVTRGRFRVDGDAEARFSSADLTRGYALRLEPSGGSLAAVLSAHLDWFDLLRTGGGAVAPLSAYQASYAQAKVAWAPTPRLSVTGAWLGAFLRDTGRTDTVGKGDLRFYDNDDHVAYLVGRWRGPGRLREAAARVFYHRLTERMDRYGCATTDGIVDDLQGCLRRDGAQLTAVRRYRDVVDVVGGDAGAEVAVIPRRLFLRVGLEAAQEYVDSSLRSATAANGFQFEDKVGNYTPGSRYLTLGLYLQAEARIVEVGRRLGWLKLTGGGRFAHVEAFAPDTPDFGDIRYRDSGGVGSAGVQLLRPGSHNLYLTFVQGFRPPNLNETTTTGDTGQKYQVPNPALQPEKSNTVEAGGKLAIGPVGVEAAYYYSRNPDAIVWEGTTYQGQAEIGGKPVVHMVNATVGTFHGVDASVAVRLWRLNLSAAASWVRGELALVDGTQVPAQRVPPPFGVAALRYDDPRHRFAAEAFVRWAGPQHRLNPEDQKDLRICGTAPFSGVLQDPCRGTPGWATVNLRGWWRVDRHLTLNVLLANLADRRYRLHGSGFDAPGVDARVTVQGQF
jgi:outer membrane receptor protein involved in Fe transport